MLKAKPLIQEFRKGEYWRAQLGQYLIVGYQFLTVIAFVAFLILALNWLRAPFLGGLIGVDHRFVNYVPMNPEPWEAYKLGLGSQDRLVAIDGIEVVQTSDLQAGLQASQPGDRVAVTVRTPAGTLEEYQFTLQDWTSLDQFTLFVLPYLLGLTFLGAGMWVLRLRRRDAAGQAFAIFATSVAIVLGAFFDLYTTQRTVGLWTLALGLTGGALFHMGLVFPEELENYGRNPLFRWLGYLPAVILAILAIAALPDAPSTGSHRIAWRYEVILLGLGGLFYLGWLISRRYTSKSPIARTQARTILWGSLISLGPMAVWFLVKVLQPNTPFIPFVLIPLGVFPLVNTYALLRYRLLNTDYILSRTALYALLTILAAVGYALLVGGFSLVLGIPLSAAKPVVIGFTIVILALLLNPLRDSLQKAIDQVFFHGRSAYEDQLQAFSHELTQAVALSKIHRVLRRFIKAPLTPTQVHIFIHDASSDQYVAAADDTGRPTSDLRFPASSALAQSLMRRQSTFFLERSTTLPRALYDDWARMSLLGAQFFIPMPGQDHLVGWIALGPRKSGEPYSDKDLAYLEALGDQAALALERAQVVVDLEQRVHQMNVLTRVAQGVNITSAYDDLLELLYAQTNQVIPTNDFLITLFDEATQAMSHAFFLEANERLREKEGVLLGERQGLASVVIETGRPIATDDYIRECRQQAVIPLIQGVYGWMSVPLNTSDATIGALSLGSRDPAVVFTDNQRDILMAIADQAASAIAKSRLLTETERRARQLATLNEVAHSLSSTLELDPLLNRILESAVEILDCEAGSLFMIDPESDELVFTVAVGPVAPNLVGQRLPPGTGLVGKAAATGQPIIANDVNKRRDWSADTDEQTGFITRAMLVLPLKVKEEPIGVIEVINKRVGGNFTEEELELLTVFTGQAAVAIENARLYTLTDQALAARVEELSVMQRIDRELNTSLDMRRATDITLEWAISQSSSTAGLVGVVEETGLQVLAVRGYSDGNGPEPNLPWLEPIQSIDKALRSGNVQVSNGLGVEGTETLLPEAGSQITIPIRREADVIGILFLESEHSGHYSEESLRFLTRLSDHAAIAIANAQFYAEVQAANLAKSDFVSFVSHELKTPMTSIKGYADLLAGGAVGPVSDAQSNFLNTIRSNVDRMATLVSDLADISRIEAGRMRLEFSAVTMSEIVEEVVRSTQAQISGKQQELISNIPDTLPQVWGDRTRLIQILTNLISNAHKYTPESGRLKIQAAARKNIWDPEGAKQVVLVSVEDNGIGIKAEDQKKIFQKFFRSEDQKAREAPGTGLGLNITKNLVDMQGGQIWFESEYRQGTIFYFTVPVIEGN